MFHKFRRQKINALLRDQVGAILNQELEIREGVITTVTRAEADDDLTRAKIFVSIFPSSSVLEVLAEIRKKVYFLQRALNAKLKMHPVPRISFVLEATVAETGIVGQRPTSGKAEMTDTDGAMAE